MTDTKKVHDAGINKDKAKKKAFVIMPFSPTPSCNDWTTVFEELIAPAITGSGLGYECDRSSIMGGPFIKDILSNLYAADVVVADLTDRNPNVFYELGVRHTLRNRTILITQHLDHIPSDLAGYGAIEYTPAIKGLTAFKKDMKRLLKQLQNDPDRADSPVGDYLKNRTYLLFDYERHDILRRLSALHAELHDNATTIIRNKHHILDPAWPILGVFTRATEDILTNQYVDIGLEVNYILKQTLLSFQKLDYLSKLLTAPHDELRKQNSGIYQHFADAALDGIFRVRGPVTKLIQDISNNQYLIERKDPIFRSIFWESSQEEIEKWVQELNEQEDRKRAEKTSTEQSA